MELRRTTSGPIRYVFANACRAIAVNVWYIRWRRRTWRIPYLEPRTLKTGRLKVRKKEGLLELIRNAVA